MAIYIRKKYFPDSTFTPGENAHGLLCTKDIYLIKDCIFDTEHLDIDDFDETFSVTWGASAVVDHCMIRGGGKLCLIGSGDENPPYQEKGKKVVFNHCFFACAGRRCPEVQSGMIVELNNCVISGWGDPDRWSVRAFGAWAHHGGEIHAKDCVFIPYGGSIPPILRIKDKLHWIGQTINYDGIRALFSASTYKSGWKRALWASNGGKVTAEHCFFSAGSWTNADENYDPMSGPEAMQRMWQLHVYFEDLKESLK